MDLYFDTENILSFIGKHKSEDYPDCLKLIQKQLNTIFNFSKEELADDAFLLAWFKSFTSGVGKTNKQVFNDSKFPERNLKANSYTSFTIEQLSSVYLISDKRIDLLKERGALMIGRPGEELDVLKQLFLQNDDYCFERSFRIGSKSFSKWQHLENLSQNLTDIIFIDSFILSDRSIIECNLIEYLKVLAVKSKCKINIIIYTIGEKIDIPFADLSEILRTEIEKVTGYKPNFTLIKVRDQRGINSLAEHDRTIFTNYLRVNSGDTFNYFRNDGSKLTKGRDITYVCFAKKENHDLALELIKDIQNNIKALRPEAIEGAKKSNYLNFN